MIWGISCLQFCKKSADHKEGNTCSEVPILVIQLGNFRCSKHFKYIFGSIHTSVQQNLVFSLYLTRGLNQDNGK